MAKLLQGLRIVEGTAFVAAPLAGMTLAQMGADVIRFDRLEGGLDHHRWPVTADGASLFWAGMNKGKRSIALDLGKPQGRELAAALICAPGPEAGVFLTNLRSKGELDYPALKARRDDLIMVSVLGTRAGGPAVDYTVNPAMGFPNATGPEGSTEPVAHVLPAWDCITGQAAAMAVLAAERHRRTHRRRSVGGAGTEGRGPGDAGQSRPHRRGHDQRRRPAEIRQCTLWRLRPGLSDQGGRRIMIVALTQRQWRGLLKVTGLEADAAALGKRLGLRLSLEGDRFTARKELSALFSPWFAARRLEEFADAFDRAGVTWSEFRSFAQAVAEDPDLSPDHPMFELLEQPGIGRYLIPGLPIEFGACPRETPPVAPVLGQHTDEILAEVAGLSSAEIGRLHDEGIVAGPRH